jgi:hypothetical protein
LHPNGSGKSLVSLDDLKFREATFQSNRIDLHGSPERLQGGQVVHGGAADTELGRNHLESLAGNHFGAKKNLLFPAAMQFCADI